MVTYYLDQHEPDCSGPVIMTRDQITHDTAEPLFYGHSDTRPLPKFPSIYLYGQESLPLTASKYLPLIGRKTDVPLTLTFQTFRWPWPFTRAMLIYYYSECHRLPQESMYTERVSIPASCLTVQINWELPPILGINCLEHYHWRKHWHRRWHWCAL